METLWRDMFFLMKFPIEEKNLIDLKKGEHPLVEIKPPHVNN